MSLCRQPTPQPTGDDAPPVDNWYSSDEDAPPLTDVLRRISEEVGDWTGGMRAVSHVGRVLSEGARSGGAYRL